ncbi:MAG TPA: hypothetical protein VIK52_10545 [Opitutaceae bacterium]
MFPPKSTLLGDIVAKLLDLISRILSPGLLENSLGFSKRIGHYAVLAGAVFTVIYGLIMAIKMEAFQLLITALVFVGVIAVAQFAAGRFLDAADKLISSTPGRVSNPAFFECTGLIMIILAVALLLSGFGVAIYARSFAVLLVPLIGVVLLLSFATIMLHPGVVNVAVGEGTAGEEAIGILTTLIKAKLKIVPLIFFLIAILGALIVLAGFFGDRFAMSFAQYVPVNLGGMPFGFVGAALIVVACMVPILVYFFFLLQYLFFDVVRSILAVPGKLDALRR